MHLMQGTELDRETVRTWFQNRRQKAPKERQDWLL